MKRILIIDDEPHIIRVLKMALENAGYAVDEAYNGEQALAYLEKCQPDLMITDIDMPKLNGRDLCLHIKQNMPNHAFDIFILTARAEIEHREWSREMERVSFLEKPVSIMKLLVTINTHFGENHPPVEHKHVG
jgi:DNA-binding response OmpR family regulator